MLRLLALLLLGVSTAHATIITIEPDDYAAGTDLSHIVPGVTLSRFRATLVPGAGWGTPVTSPILSTEYVPLVGTGPAPTGTRVFGHGFGYPVHASMCLANSSACATSFSPLRIDFDAPIDFFEMSVALEPDYTSVIYANPAMPGSNSGLYSRVNTAGRACDTYPLFHENSAQTYRVCTYTFDLSERPATSLLIGGDLGSIAVDRIRFRTASVPEPATAGLLALGVISTLVARRRRNNKKD